jgi:hypothetical protein
VNLRFVLSYLWKLPLCTLGFVTGFIMGGPLLAALNLEAPEMPAGADANTILIWIVLSSLIVAFVLSFIAQGIGGRLLSRWLILFSLIWGGSAVNMVIEASLFMTTSAVASSNSMLFTMLTYLLPSLLMAGALAWLFPPRKRGMGLVASLRVHFARRQGRDWIWRLPLAAIAFPLIYFTFGRLILPLVEDVYAQGLYEMQAPTWAELIPVQLARGVLFVAIALPVLATWQRSQRRLGWSLGMAFFVLLAFMSVFTAYWLPLGFRIIHGAEILADSLVYAWVVVLLLADQRIESGQHGMSSQFLPT